MATTEVLAAPISEQINRAVLSVRTATDKIYAQYAPDGSTGVEPYSKRADAAAEQKGLLSEDHGILTSLLSKVEELGRSGNRLGEQQARYIISLLTDKSRSQIQKRRKYDKSDPNWNPKDPFYAEVLAEIADDKISSPSTDNVMAVSTDTISKIAEAVTLGDEEAHLRFSNTITSADGRSQQLDLDIGKDLRREEGKGDIFSVGFRLADLSEGSPASPIANVVKLMCDKNIRSRVYSFLLKHYDPKQAEDIVENAILWDIICGSVIEPNSPRQQATLAYYGLLPEKGQYDNRAITDDFLRSHLARKLRTAEGIKEVIVGQSTQTAGQEARTQVDIKTAKGWYRAYYDPASQNVTVESVPAFNRHRSRQDWITEGMQITNLVYANLYNYLNVEVDNPGIVTLPPELEKGTRIELQELADTELNMDWEHVGGLPASVRKRIQRIIDGTKAYNAEESDTKPNNLMFTGPTGVGKSAISVAIANEFHKAGMPIFMVSATEAQNPRNLVRALMTFQKTTDGGVMIIDDVEKMLRGDQRDVDEARASLHRVLLEINKDPAHTLILNTENIDRVTGENEALAQTHRMDVLPCEVELSQAGIEDLVRGVIAKLKTKDRTAPIKRNDEAVNVEIQRLGAGRDPAEVYRDLLELATRYQEKAPLTVGVLADGAFKAANWEKTTFAEILEELPLILDTKAGIHTRATVAEAQRMLQELQAENEQEHNEFRATLQLMSTIIIQLQTQIGDRPAEQVAPLWDTVHALSEQITALREKFEQAPVVIGAVGTTVQAEPKTGSTATPPVKPGRMGGTRKQ